MLQVLVTDEQGNPVANDDVVITFAKDPAASAVKDYTIASNKVQKTNEKGIATFVASPLNSSAKNNDSDYLGTYDYKVTDASGNISTKGKLKVATVSYTSSEQYTKHWWETVSNDVIGLNGSKLAMLETSESSKLHNSLGYAYTTNILGNNTAYVSSQQVSTSGKDHTVGFKTAVYLNVPKATNDESKATKYVQDVKATSGTYGTYDSKKKEIKYDITDFSNVDYATLHFNNLSLSQYTKATVAACDKDGNVKKTLATYGSNTKAFSQKNFGLQIQKADLNYDGATQIIVSIESKGQVDPKNNAGFDIENLTYVYKNQGTVASEQKALDSVKVKWEQVTPVYSAEANVSTTVKTAVEQLAGANYEKVTAMIPVFPYVGNAIIKCYDKNNVLKKYFTAATKNDGKNVNIIDTATDLYEISEDEALNSVGTVTDGNDGTVTVDTTKSGTTFLKATLTSEDENLILDSRYNEVYTAVMWNPVVNTSVSAKTGLYGAFEGQSVTLTAQLVDKNGNPVSKSGEAISWKGTTDDIDVITKEVSTNAKGQAKYVLNSAVAGKVAYGIAAENSSYDVVLTVNNETVEKAEVYWVSAAIAFTNMVNNDSTGTTVNTADTGNAATTVYAKSGETRMYNTQVIPAGTDFSTQYSGWSINGNYSTAVNAAVLTGANADVDITNATVGTVTKEADNAVTVTSTKTGSGSIVYTLNSDSKIAAGATITFTNQYNSSDKKTLTLIGEGAASFDEKMTVTYVYGTEGLSISFIDASLMGTKSSDKDKVAYIKVTDTNGNPLKDKIVELSTASTMATLKSKDTVTALDPATVSGSAIAGTVTTGADGIAAFSIVGNATIAKAYNVTVTAKVLDNDDPTKYDSTVSAVSNVYSFKADDVAFAVTSSAIEVSDDASGYTVVTLTANENILQSSLIADQFEVTLTESGTARTFNASGIRSVKADGKKIVITLNTKKGFETAAGNSVQVDYASADKDSVTYAVTSTLGSTLADGSLTKTY